MDFLDIGFGNAGLDLDFIEIGEHQNRRRNLRGDDGLPFTGHDAQHFAIHRRENAGIAEVGVGGLHAHFRLHNLRLIHRYLLNLRGILRLRLFEIAAHAGAVAAHGLLARQRFAVLHQHGLRGQLLRSGAGQLRGSVA